MNKYQEKLDEVMRIDAEEHSIDFSLLIIKSLIEDLGKDLPECELVGVINDIIEAAENVYIKKLEQNAIQD